MIDKKALISQLSIEEGMRHKVYDDANGKPLRPGSTVHGHPTIGIGRALDVNGISDDEAQYLLNNDIDRTISALDRQLSWWRGMSEPRQRVFVDMAFNLGIPGFLAFRQTLYYAEHGQYDKAAAEILDSKAAKQLPSRYERLAAMMRTGNA